MHPPSTGIYYVENRQRNSIVNCIGWEVVRSFKPTILLSNTIYSVTDFELLTFMRSCSNIQKSEGELYYFEIRFVTKMSFEGRGEGRHPKNHTLPGVDRRLSENCSDSAELWTFDFISSSRIIVELFSFINDSKPKP